MNLKPALLIPCLALLAVGCGSPAGGNSATGPGGKKQIKVGFSQLGADSDFRRAETASIQAEAKKRGIDLKFADAQGKQQNQLQEIRSFIAQKVDVILVAPIVESGWDAVFKEAKDAHIPVVLIDHMANVSDDSLYECFVGADLVEEGRRAGKKLAELMGGKGNVAVVEGKPGSTPAIDREKGFEDALKASPDIKITFHQTAEWDRVKGKEVMEACLKADKNIQGMFAHNDDMGLGALQAIKEAGLKPGVDIKIVSCDAIKQCLEAIAKGESNATIECNPLLGPTIFDTVEKLVQHQKVERKIIAPDAEFDKSNAEKSLPDRQY